MQPMTGPGPVTPSDVAAVDARSGGEAANPEMFREALSAAQRGADQAGSARSPRGSGGESSTADGTATDHHGEDAELAAAPEALAAQMLALLSPLWVQPTPDEATKVSLGTALAGGEAGEVAAIGAIGAGATGRALAAPTLGSTALTSPASSAATVGAGGAGQVELASLLTDTASATNVTAVAPAGGTSVAADAASIVASTGAAESAIDPAARSGAPNIGAEQAAAVAAATTGSVGASADPSSIATTTGRVGASADPSSVATIERMLAANGSEATAGRPTGAQSPSAVEATVRDATSAAAAMLSVNGAPAGDRPSTGAARGGVEGAAAIDGLGQVDGELTVQVSGQAGASGAAFSNDGSTADGRAAPRFADQMVARAGAAEGAVDGRTIAVPAAEGAGPSAVGTVDGATIQPAAGLTASGVDGAAEVSTTEAPAAPVATQLADGLEMARRRPGQTVQVVLQPEGLGTVSLRIGMEQGGLGIHIGVDNPMTRDLVQASWPQLQEALDRRGLNVQDMFLDLAGGQDGRARAEGQAWADGFQQQAGRQSQSNPFRSARAGEPTQDPSLRERPDRSPNRVDFRI